MVSASILIFSSENSDASLPSSPGKFLRKSDISVLTMFYSCLWNQKILGEKPVFLILFIFVSFMFMFN
jgi:hypothetical protein